MDILSNLVITRVHSAATFFTPQNTKIKRYDRPCWAILIKYEGETVYTWEGKRIVSDLQHITILPAGSSYEWECTKMGHFCSIEFDCVPLKASPFSCSVKNGERILKMFKELEYKRNLKNETVELESIRDTYSILLALMQAGNDPYAPREKQKKIAPALEFISQHYSESITNDHLASLCGISTVYFRKLFTGIVGIAPMNYVQKMRIEKAKEMLKSDYGTLSDLAYSLGYPSLYDFSRSFKKHTGIAPSQYGKEE